MPKRVVARAFPNTGFDRPTAKHPTISAAAGLVGCLVNTSYVGGKVPATLGSTTRERGEGFKIPGWPVNRLVCCFLHAKFGVGVQADVRCVGADCFVFLVKSYAKRDLEQIPHNKAEGEHKGAD